MSVPIPFTVYPVRHVPMEPATPRWTVAIHRAGAWPGWRWLDRVLDWTEDAAFVPLLLLLLALPSIVVRRLAYLLRRRTDWDVLVYRGGKADHRPKDAVMVENLPSKAAAAERAEELWRHLDGHDGLPAKGA